MTKRWRDGCCGLAYCEIHGRSTGRPANWLGYIGIGFGQICAIWVNGFDHIGIDDQALGAAWPSRR